MPQKPLDISTPLFYPRAEEQQHHFRVSSRVMPMPPGQTKVFGFAPTWCTTKYLARNCGVFFYCLFLRELPFVHHWGREWLGSRARTKKKKPKNIRWKVFRLFVISLEWRKQYDWSADGYLYHRDDWKSFYWFLARPFQLYFYQK